jgi:hypothetical protein
MAEDVDGEEGNKRSIGHGGGLDIRFTYGSSSRYDLAMMPDRILANAERLIADARYLYGAGRGRSAATLIVVALEQFGSFIEELTKERYPNTTVHMGIFGDDANAHARRQDALAGHVLNYILGQFFISFLAETFYKKTGCGDAEKFMQWSVKAAAPMDFTEEQKQRMKDSEEMKSASLLMQLVRDNRLKEIREFGFYENSKRRFSLAAIQQVMELAESVQKILVESRKAVVPHPMEMAGINMPEGIVMDDQGKWRVQLIPAHEL